MLGVCLGLFGGVAVELLVVLIWVFVYCDLVLCLLGAYGLVLACFRLMVLLCWLDVVAWFGYVYRNLLVCCNIAPLVRFWICLVACSLDYMVWVQGFVCAVLGVCLSEGRCFGLYIGLFCLSLCVGWVIACFVWGGCLLGCVAYGAFLYLACMCLCYFAELVCVLGGGCVC